jgi:hypothetical protein
MMPLRARVGFWGIAATLIALWLWLMPPLHRSGLDLRYYYAGAERILQGKSPFVVGGGYIYPPFLAQALAFIPLGREQVSVLWNGMLATAALLTIGLGVLAGGLWGSTYAALAFLLLWSEPIAWSLTLCNASLLVAGILALAAVSFRRLPILAGFLIGLAAAIKIVPALILVWIVGVYVRQRDRAWLQAAAAGSLTFAISLIHPDTPTYLQIVQAEAQLRVALGSNFSVFSTIEHAFGVQLPSVVGPLLGAAAAFVLGLCTREGAAATRAGWGVAQLIMLASAPVAWSHMFVLAFWPALVAAGEVATDSRRTSDPQRWRLQALLIAIAFAILARVKLFFSEASYFTYVITPLAPLIAIILIGAQLLRSVRGERKSHRIRMHARQHL